MFYLFIHWFNKTNLVKHKNFQIKIVFLWATRGATPSRKSVLLYFCIKYRDFKDVIEFPSYHKTQELKAPKKFGKIKKKYKNGKTRFIKDNHD